MFAWAMATVAADEYPNFWGEDRSVHGCAGGNGGKIPGTRSLVVGHAGGNRAGIGIGTHVFHSHCDPELSDGCKHHHNKVEYRADLSRRG